MSLAQHRMTIETQGQGLYEITRAGRTIWSYHPTTGAAKPNHPSLAEQLPGGCIAGFAQHQHPPRMEQRIEMVGAHAGSSSPRKARRKDSTLRASAVVL